MTTFVALLHSIVLGPSRRVVMADLRDMAAGLGLRQPRTLVATGNLVFAADRTSAARLEPLLERAFAEKFSKHVDIVVRSAPDWRKLAAGNPFQAEADTDPDKVGVRVMRAPVADVALADLGRFAAPGERIAVVDRDLWVHFADGTTGSRLLGAATTRRLGVGTWRNWNTVRGLAEMIGT